MEILESLDWELKVGRTPSSFPTSPSFLRDTAVALMKKQLFKNLLVAMATFMHCISMATLKQQQKFLNRIFMKILFFVHFKMEMFFFKAGLSKSH